MDSLLPEDQLRSFRGMPLETAQYLKAQQTKGGDAGDPDNKLQQFKAQQSAQKLTEMAEEHGLTSEAL